MMRKSLIAITGSIACTGCSGEMADKPVWADLQAVEYDDRSSRSNGTEVRRLPDGLAVLAIQGKGDPLGPRVAGPQQPRRSWIVLNEHASDEQVKQMVTFSAYDLRCTEVDGLEGNVSDIDGYVVRFLRTLCNK